MPIEAKIIMTWMIVAFSLAITSMGAPFPLANYLMRAFSYMVIVAVGAGLSAMWFLL